MRKVAIRVDSLGKRYRIGSAGSGMPRYKSLRDSIAALGAAPVRVVRRMISRNGRTASKRDETFWALRDISLEIGRGEVVGIIGRNGAGKSTLLKVLTRITEPTTGRAEIYGRVGSLLEVGTGFHPELTGRENMYLNGAILGMSRAEINRKFDEIVAFAEIEKFIDTPVKFYSSGMYVRLAFAVAAHLEPEILIVDEVLAVGDVRFQKKCLNKMQDVGQDGRTVVFVSHSMTAITRLCSRAILLESGRVLADGPTAQVVSAYLNAERHIPAERRWDDPAKAPGGDIARLRAMRVYTMDKGVTDVVDIRQPVALEMEYDVLRPGYVLLPHYHLANEEGRRIFTTLDQDPAWRRRPRPVGRYTSTAWVPGNLFSEGTVFVHPNLITM